jgi:hypothetical protein
MLRHSPLLRHAALAVTTLALLIVCAPKDEDDDDDDPVEPPGSVADMLGSWPDFALPSTRLNSGDLQLPESRVASAPYPRGRAVLSSQAAYDRWVQVTFRSSPRTNNVLVKAGYAGSSLPTAWELEMPDLSV